MASTAVLSTLEHVTKVKLDKLARQQDAFEKSRLSVFDAVKRRDEPVERVKYLLDALKTRRGGKLDNAEYHNIDRLLFQARYDASISTSILGEWQRKLEQEFNWQHERYRFTSLFGRLVIERIQNPNEATRSQTTDSDSDGDLLDVDSSFEAVGREEMHEQRKEWESYAFSERSVDIPALETYLKTLFESAFKSKESMKSPLETLREQISDFDEAALERFDVDIIRSSIDGLLKADLFAGEKRNALVNLRSQNKVLSEIADVLNADLDTLETWDWDSSPVQVSMRKQINGKYRVYMDEEIYQAIFLQWIGTMWAVHLREAFISFFNSGAWIQAPYRSLTKKDMRRREHFLGASAANLKKNSIRNQRRSQYLEDFFMTQLPSSVQEGNREYGIDDDSDSEDEGPRRTPLEIKQSLLALVATESLINTHIYGKFCVLQSDFKWFGPSLPHSTIFAVLGYFGVPERWIVFFKKFLRPSLVFAQDGTSAGAQARVRGIPMSHVLADAMGEAILFVLDFAVNQKTAGANLYRFHDDLWFWGQPSSCIDAWKAMTDFADVTGLVLNEDKSGACLVSSDSRAQPLPKGLPEGDIRWGFLKMESGSGRWAVDTAQIKEHTEELKRQLAVCRSVFAYIQAYNAYMSRFFLNNLGTPKVCLGHAHLEMCMNTIASIEKNLFPGGSIAEHLRQTIAERFDFNDVPDGFLYFPPELGGLGTRNPIIPLVRKLDRSKDPMSILNEAYEREEEEYETAKKKYEAGEIKHVESSPAGLSDEEPFMSLEEYMGFREERSKILLDVAYNPLRENLDTVDLMSSRDLTDAMQITGNIKDLYWISEIYGRNILKRFGGLCMGERDMLPIGLLDMLNSEKVRWQG